MELLLFTILEKIKKAPSVGAFNDLYYTMTATVTWEDYDYHKTKIRCQVQSDNIIVSFWIEFREGFEAAVGLYDEGDEIRFRGRFYDEGCGFTDCELISE